MILNIILIWGIIGAGLYVYRNNYWPERFNLVTFLYGPLVWYAYILGRLDKRLKRTDLKSAPDRKLKSAPDRKVVLEKLKQVACSEDLDEIVHDFKAQEASRINNEGVDAQLAYLDSQGADLNKILIDYGFLL